MELETRHLKLVRAIAEDGTMTRAGARLHLSQSALSHQLTDLEAALGVPVFRRVPRGMVLTAAGDRLLTAARAILQELKTAEEQVKACSAQDRGTLRMATECYTCYHWLPAKLRDFQTEFPDVEVRIVVEHTREPIPALLAGHLDVAIVSDTPRQKGMAVRRLFTDELVAIVHPGHPLSGRPFLRAADFADQHLITYSVPMNQLTVFQRLLAPAGITPSRISRVELTEAIIEMVKAGLGIAVLARWAVAPYLNPGSLKALQLTRKGYRREWSAVTQPIRHQPGYVKAFLDLMAGGM